MEVKTKAHRALNFLITAIIVVLCSMLCFVMTGCDETVVEGVKITSVVKTATEGNLDTYTITFSDGKTGTFTIKNGVDGQAGKDGVSITDAEINEEGELVISLSEGDDINLGKVVGEKGDDGDEGAAGVSVTGATINSLGELILSFSNESEVNLGKITGNDGKNGVSVTGANMSESGVLTLTFSEGGPIEIGSIKGKDGVGIEGVDLSSEGELSVTLTDKTVIPLGSVVGPKGEDGAPGKAGESGENGKSAFELYRESFGYTGTEQQWLTDLVNGALSTLSYTVTFNPDNGEESFTQTVKKGEKLTNPTAPTREGYEFLGWYGGVDNSEKWVFIGYPVTESITLTALWEKTERAGFTATYNAIAGASNPNPTSFTGEDLPITLKPLFISGYAFDGWYASSDFSGERIIAIDKEEDIILYAKTVKATEGITYSLSSDQSYYIVTGYEGTDSEVFIPSVYEGKEVREIGNKAFYAKTVAKVVLPETITVLGQQSFNTLSLTSVNIPSGVTIIPSHCFYQSAITEIVIPASVIVIEKKAFYDCKSLTTVTFEVTDGWYQTSDGTATTGATVIINDSFYSTLIDGTYNYLKRNA